MTTMARKVKPGLLRKDRRANRKSMAEHLAGWVPRLSHCSVRCYRDERCPIMGLSAHLALRSLVFQSDHGVDARRAARRKKSRGQTCGDQQKDRAADGQRISRCEPIEHARNQLRGPPCYGQSDQDAGYN